MQLRKATTADLEAIAAMEAECFPASEACTKADFEKRLASYPGHFFLLFDEEGRLASFTDGMATDEEHLSDEMYANASMHNPGGSWQMVFGLNTRPDCRRRGYAGLVLKALIDDAKASGRKGVVLTCKDHLVPYYSRFGFADEGLSGSTHGSVAWHEMRLTF